MRRIAFLIISLIAAISVDAQSIDSFKRHLAESVQIDSLRTIVETVQVVEYGDAATAVAMGEALTHKTANGYRMVVFMSNTPSARADAVAANERFSSLFPDQKSYVIYENPYFKVTAGNFLTHEEAIVVLEKVRRTFPKAFLMRETISASDLVVPKKEPISPVEEGVKE